MDPELRALLEPYLREPVRLSGQQTQEQALNLAAEELAYMARTFLDYDGEISVGEIRAALASSSTRR